MNTSHESDPAAFEREWQLQERALQHERARLDASADDARVSRYRLLARSLRQPLQETLPTDFAYRIAAMASAREVLADDAEQRFDRRLLQAAIGVFGLVIVGVIVWYGGDWLVPTSATARVGALLGNRWLLMLTACLAVSVMTQRVARGLDRDATSRG
jgi:hypothetical protein